MKKILFMLGLAAAGAVNLFAGETLQLNLVPERGYVVRNSPQEIVIKIDLAAIADRPKVRRTPLNLAVVLDKSGSMTGAKLEKTKQAAMQLVDRLAAALNRRMAAIAPQLPALAPVARAVTADDAPAVGAAILPFNHRLLPTRFALLKGE